MRLIIVCLIILGISLPALSYAQSDSGFVKKMSHKWPFNVKHSHQGFIANPLIFYTPETRLALGISTVYYFRTSKKDTAFRPSVTHPFFGLTQNHQVFIEAPFQLFFKQEKYYIYGELAFYKYPYKYFGIGNHEPKNEEFIYDAIYPSCSLTVLKKVTPKFYAGIRYNFDYYKISFPDTSNILYRESFTGKNGGLNNGLGLQLLYDTRDNIFSTHKGSYLEFISVFDSKKITFSKYTYQWFVFDLRKFISFKGTHILALQYYANLMAGDPPFYQMALLGGEHRMRGYYQGRYRDKNYTATQIEYRSPLWRNRIGFALFTGTGLVFHNFKQFDLTYLKPSVGGGLRFRFNRKEKINFRIDAAYGESFNYYFVLSEAF